MSELNLAVLEFRNELEKIESPDVRTFAQNVLAATDESFYKNEETVAHTKKVFKILSALMDKEYTKGMLRDIMLASVLFSDITVNSLSDELKYLHPVTFSDFLKKVEMGTDLPEPVLEGLVSMIESHEFEASPSKALEPKPGTPNFLIAFANRIARFDFVTIEI